jgi:hypothetical protein
MVLLKAFNGTFQLVIDLQCNNAAYSSSSSERFLTKGQTGEGRERENLAISDARSEIGEPQG